MCTYLRNKYFEIIDKNVTLETHLSESSYVSLADNSVYVDTVSPMFTSSADTFLSNVRQYLMKLRMINDAQLERRSYFCLICRVTQTTDLEMESIKWDPSEKLRNQIVCSVINTNVSNAT